MTQTPDLATRETELAPRVTFELAETAHALAQATALAKMVETQCQEGHHFMRIPGTPSNQRPHLCDPGAGLIMTGYKVRTGGYRLLESVWDDENDHYSLAIEASLVHIASGVVVSTGVGAATSHEVKYAYRWVRMEETPAGLDRNLLPTRIRKSDGARMYRVENPDMGDLYNTLWKMAAKRAEGDAVLKLPGCSELFGGFAVNQPKRPQPKKEEPKPRTPEQVQQYVDELYEPDEEPPAKPAPAQPKPQVQEAKAPPTVAGLKQWVKAAYGKSEKEIEALLASQFTNFKTLADLATMEDLRKAVNIIKGAWDAPAEAQNG